MVLDKKINKLDTKLEDNCMILNKKHSTLKDQIIKLFKIIDHEKYNKVDIVSANNDEIKSFESRIKSLLINDQSNLQNFYNNLITNIESRITSFARSFHKERNSIHNMMEELKNKVEVSFYATEQ